MPPTGERLLSIGEFSRASRLSVRMLRYYDDHEVLHPTRVDPWTGFRLYAPDLLGTAQWVRKLRDIGLGVAEIATCVPLLDDAAAMRLILEQQRARLVDQAASVADQVTGVDHLITTMKEPVMSITTTSRTLPARTVASVRDTIPSYNDEGLLWQRLMAGLSATGAVPASNSCASACAVFHDTEFVESNADVEVQLEVAAPFEATGDVHCVQVPEQLVAVSVLKGSYEGIGAVTDAMGRWVPENGFQFAGPMFNIYVVSPSENPDPAAWVTEVCLPIAAIA